MIKLCWKTEAKLEVGLLPAWGEKGLGTRLSAIASSRKFSARSMMRTPELPPIEQRFIALSTLFLMVAPNLTIPIAQASLYLF